MKSIHFGLLLFGLIIPYVTCYSTGLVSVVCETMQPRHGNNTPQTVEPLYTVSASNYSFSPGDSITVTLQANSDVDFKGFLLQAHAASGSNPVGYFTVTDSNAQTLNCNGTVVVPGSNPPNVSTSSSPALTSSTHTVTTGLPPTHISSSSCGTSKVCFRNPSNCDPSTSNGCFFMSSAPVTGDGYQFEISGPSAGFVAIGFSDDKIMGNDDIYICGMDSVGGVGIQHAYSEGRTRPITLNLTNVEIILASYSNGVIQCSFISRNNVSTENPVRQSRSNDNLYYILMAYGDSSAGRIQYHGASRTIVSDSKIDISLISNVTIGSSGVNTLIKAHGSLMLIAWMTTGSLGMILARYMKAAAKNLVFGKAAWFQSHVLFMVLTVAATITSFVLAFVKAQGWSYGANIHAIIGCIVMILTFFQPIIAVFRPSPESSRRFIFNWFHGLNAFVIKVLAVANLFLGLQLINGTSGWMVKVMGGFLGWNALNVILFEINALMARKETQKTKDTEKEEALVKYELFLLPFYVCGNLAFLIAILVGIGQS